MNRRDTVFALIVFVAAPPAAMAQQVGKVWRIGYLSLASRPDELVEVFREELRHLGYVEGRNLFIEYRWAAGKDERLPELAADLVRLNVDVIVTRSVIVTAATKRATTTIPIVMATAADPVGGGVVASLARPGGNVTGMTQNSTEFAGKRLQLLRELVPKATRVGILAWKDSPLRPLFLEQLGAAATQMGIELVLREIRTAEELAGAFVVLQRERAQALVVQVSPFTNENRKRIVELAAQYRLPAMFETRSVLDVGELIAYGPSLPEMSRRAAHYLDKIFKGAKPADLPVEQPTKFELVINLTTAKSLGLTIPPSLLLRADRVIE